MADRDPADQLFAGHVRLYRWKSAERFSFTAAADTLGQDNSSASYQKATDSILLQLVHDLTAVKATIG